MTLVARHAALTDIGLHRSTNEDAFVAAPPLFAVADGMGGAQAGEVASHLALESLVEAVAADAALPDAALAANAAVFQRSRTDRSHSGMGTTLTAALLRADRLEYAHIGDSRLYLWRDETLEQVTDDHSLVGEMVRGGHLTREAALSHPQRSILSRALGTEPRAAIDSGEVALAAGDAVVLCSDGLYSMVPDATIAAVLAAVDDPSRVARQLVREAKNEGGHDNITVIVLRFDEAGAGGGEAAAAEAAAASPPPADDEAETGVLPALGEPEAGGEQLTLDEQAAGDAPPADDAGAPEAPDVTGGAPLEEAADAAETPDAPEAPSPASTADAPEEAQLAAAAADAPEEAPPADADTAPADAAAKRPRGRRLRLAVAAVALLAVCLLAGAVAADTVYFVGDQNGMVSVYHGLPWRVGGLKLYGLYLETTTPVATVTPGVLARVERHDLHRKSAALALARQAQGLP